MARVICELEHASETINGVRFTSDRGQMVSDEIGDDMAAMLASIPGFILVGGPPVPPLSVAEMVAAYVAPDGFKLVELPANVALPPPGYMLAPDSAALADDGNAEVTMTGRAGKRGN